MSVPTRLSRPTPENSILPRRWVSESKKWATKLGCLKQSPLAAYELVQNVAGGIRLSYAEIKRVTDGARTRDLLSRATIRTHRFVVVRRGSGLRVNKPITRIGCSLVFADVRPGCRQNCRQYPSRLASVFATRYIHPYFLALTK